jgi:hypothetical protein
MKHKIEVRKDGVLIACIKRKIWAEQWGNFNPMFCRYQYKRCLVKSEEGDISDPFRREESYLTSLYIEIKDEI